MTLVAAGLATGTAALLPPTAQMVAGTARARHAADAVALAVMAASPLAASGASADHDDPPSRALAAGGRVAAANGARVVSVDLAGWPHEVVATVEIPSPWPPLPDLRATAAARLTAPPTSPP